MTPPDGPVVTAADRAVAMVVVERLPLVTVACSHCPKPREHESLRSTVLSANLSVDLIATALATVRAEGRKMPCDHVTVSNDALHARVTALEGALRRYGAHDPFCGRRRWQGSHKRAVDAPGTNTMELTSDPCTCGFDKALTPGAGGTA